MKKIVRWLLPAIVLAGGFLAWHTGWLALAYYRAIIEQPSALGAYRATIEARPMAGVPENASGLTYHPERKTLFSVINRPPQVAELTTEGKLLRLIDIKGLKDIEGISHVRGNRFVISDEADHQLVSVEIPDDATIIDVSGQPRLGLAIDIGKNVGFEGVSWDDVGNRLFVVKEKNPMRVLEIGGLRELLEGSRFDLQIKEWQPAESVRLLMTDLSSLTYHETSGHMLLLSDESHMVVEFDAGRSPLGMLVLRAGWHGLGRTVPQAEGVAMTPEGTLFVLSEPNLFYRFEPARP